MLELVESVPYRRNTRAPLSIPIIISGKAKGGRDFEESTQTIDVGKQGVRTTSLNSLYPNAEIGIRRPGAGKSQLGRVVWQKPTQGSDGHLDIGVEFLEPFEAGRTWAFETQPDDWLQGSLMLTLSQKLDYFWTRHKTLPMRPEMMDMTGGVQSPKAQTSSGATTVEHEAERAPSLEPARLSKVVEPIALEATFPFQVAAPLSETSGREAGCPNPRPQAVPRSIEGNLRMPGDPKKTPPTGRNHETPEESPAAVLGRFAQMLSEQADTISKGIDRAVSSVQSAAQDAIAELQNAQRRIEDQLETKCGEHRNQLAALGASSLERLHQNSEASLAEFRNGLQRQLDHHLESIGVEHQERLAALGAAGAEQIRQNSEELLANFRNQLQQTLDAFREKTTRDTQDQLRKVAAGLRETTAMEQRDLEERSADFRAQNERHFTTLLEKTRKEIIAVGSWSGLQRIAWILAMLTIASIALMGFAYYSTQPVMRLRADPPAEFIDTTGKANQGSAEEGLARAYWNCAVGDLQRTYKYGMILPEQPPPEFEIQAEAAGDVRFKPLLKSSRARYWERLRKVWDNPVVWEESYVWNTDWFITRLKSLGEFLRG